MGTAEIIIVFSALMALIALVTVGIDWIGKPLKHRRFIPRMYRFEDEKLPIDAYGHTDFGVPEPDLAVPPMAQPMPMPHVQPMPMPHVQPMPMPHVQPPPVVVAQVPAPQMPRVGLGASETVAVPVAAAPTTGRSTSAFSDSLAAPEASKNTPPIDVQSSPMPQQSPVPRVAAAPGAWAPGLALDTTINDRKPNLATKAQRFWMATAATLGDSHFDSDDVQRMQAGKAPSRKNPRTGRTESMQLTGLRRAIQPDEVQMSWPEDSIDPWSTS